MQVVEILLPEYKIDSRPDYLSFGSRVDRLIGTSFVDGRYVMRAIGSSDHPGKSLDEVVEIILEMGTDKYDRYREEVGDFSAYRTLNPEHIYTSTTYRSSFDMYASVSGLTNWRWSVCCGRWRRQK